MQRQPRFTRPEELSTERLSAHQPLPNNAEIRWFSSLQSDVAYWADIAEVTVEELFAATDLAIRLHHGAAQVHRRLCPEYGSLYSLGLGKLVAYYNFNKGVAWVRGYAPNLPEDELPQHASDADAMAFGGYYS